jgi:hypothetical protein
VAGLRATGVLPAAATAPELAAVAWVVGTAQPLALGLDLWAFSQMLPTNAAASRAVAVPGGWLLPRPGRPLSGGAGGTNPDAALRAGGANTNTVANALFLTGRLTVTLTGEPSAAWAAGAGVGAAAPGAQTLTFSSDTGAVRVPAGALTPGFIYKAVVTLSGAAAQWSWRTDVVGWPLPAWPVAASVAQAYDPRESYAFAAPVTGELPSLLFAHVPPIGGGASAFPAVGQTVVSPLAVTSLGWYGVDSFSLGSGMPSDAAAAIALIAAFPLATPAIAALAQVATGATGLASVAGSDAGGAECSTAFPLGAASPAWARAQGALFSALPADGASACASGVAAGVASAAAFAGGQLPEPTWAFSFRYDTSATMLAASAWPLGLVPAAGGVLPWASVATFSATGGALPGTPWTAAALSVPTFSTYFPEPAGGSGGRFVVIVAAIDTWGSAGLAYVAANAQPIVASSATSADAQAALLTASALLTARAGGSGSAPSTDYVASFSGSTMTVS